MASKYQLVVTSSGINGTTGHHTIQCHIEETRDDGTTVKGISDTFGIESTALDRAHNNDPSDWLKWVGEQMLNRHIRRSLAHAEISTWHGKKFDIQP